MGICVSCRRRELQARDKRTGGGRAPSKGAAVQLLSSRADPAMANSISNIKMANPIKGIVSKRRKRYIKDGFNLDLAYITDRLIAMGFPAEKLEGVYRNHIDEVYRFLEQMHKDHYKIYNLCSERCYDSSKFHGRVARYAFDDHTPPNMELIQPFCEDVHKWLSADPRNVAAVHCKAGKGRTGTMVCCYLLYSGQMRTADEALKFYGTKRTHDEKGVTIPSQRRYVEYYAALVRGNLQYSATKMHIRELVMSPPPALNQHQPSLELSVSQATPPLKAPGGCHEVRRGGSSTRVVLQQCTPLSGDVRVDVYNKPKMMMRKEKLFHFWFNTFFVANGVGAVRVPAPNDSMNLETFKLTLNKWQLDDAHKDKQHKLYSPDFKVEVVVQQQPASSRFVGAGGASPSPPDSDPDLDPDLDLDPDDLEHWDSGETTTYLPQPYLLIDTSPRRARLSDPSHSKLSFPVSRCRVSDPTGKSKGALGTVTKDGYMLVDATPRQPNVKFDRPSTTSADDASFETNRLREADEYMEFTAADGYMRPLDPVPDYTDEYALVYPESSKSGEGACKLVTDSSDRSDDSSDAPSEGKGKNKKHSFFKKDDGKGKIPKVSSDHTISDDAKKKYTFFHKKDEEGSKPRFDVRASWREFSGKWSDNRKKKDRDDS